MADEVLQRELRRREVGRRADVGQRQPAVLARLQEVGENRPSTREISDAVTNRPSALPNSRPTDDASPTCAMPTTSVEKTSDPISILIRRENTSDMKNKHSPRLRCSAAHPRRRPAFVERLDTGTSVDAASSGKPHADAQKKLTKSRTSPHLHAVRVQNLQGD